MEKQRRCFDSMVHTLPPSEWEGRRGRGGGGGGEGECARLVAMARLSGVLS